MIALDSNLKERFISKLIKDTKIGELEWEADSNSKLTLPSTERPISKVYTTSLNDKILRLYEFQIKYYTDEYEWDWVERIRLEIIDSVGDSLYEYNYDYSFYKLFNAIRASNSNVDDFMKGYLNE